MTGYLQRLIASATTPSRLHPFTAPLHATEPPPAPALTLQQEIPDQPPDRPSAPRNAEADFPAPPGPESQMPAPASNIQPSPPDVLHHHRALRAIAPATPPPGAPLSPRSVFHTETITNTTAIPWAPAPSATPTLPEIVARLTDTPPRPAPFITPPPRRAATVTRTPQPIAESTQVNIHIGRVDVIAVPTSAPRPAAAATSARKPMSLDEYLRRQDGRA